MREGSGTIWRALGTTLVALASAAPAAGLAQAGPTISFRAPAGCPDDRAVRREIEALLGRPLASIDAPLVIDAEAIQLEGRWLLRLQAEDIGERDIHGENCAALAQAAALMVAWMIDPSVETMAPAMSQPRDEADDLRIEADRADRSTAALDAAIRLGAPERPAMAGAPLSSAHRLADPDPVPVRGRVSFGFGPSILLDVGTLPSVSAGVGGEFVLRYDQLDLRLRGSWIAPQRAVLPQNGVLRGLDADAGAIAEHAGGSFHVCGRPLDSGMPALSFCGGLAMGAIFATGQGVHAPRSEAGLISALTLGAAIPWEPSDELDLELAAELSIPFVTPTFEFGVGSDRVDVFTPAPISGRLTITGHIDVR